jgi:nucleoside-diphosphate-sugar epimerase
MHVFVTGATGFVGSAVVRQLIAAGHRTTGLARSDQSAAALEAAGAAVLRGDLRDTASLTEGATASDAVIHTAFIHDFSNFAESVEVEKQALDTLGTALAGSGKPFLMTSGTGLLAGERVSEETPAASEGHAALRGATETLALGFADRGVRVGIIRLPFSVHGRGDHGFVPALIGIARAKGLSGYIDAGDNLWPAVHRDDAALLYRLALEAGVPMPRYHAVGEEGMPFREIATAIGRGLGLPVKSIPRSEAAEHFGWMGAFAGLGASASSATTRERLGWRPTGPGLIEDIATAGYLDG